MISLSLSGIDIEYYLFKFQFVCKYNNLNMFFFFKYQIQNLKPNSEF